MNTYWCLISLPSLAHHQHPIYETLVAQIELRFHILKTSISLNLNYTFEILVILNHLPTHYPRPLSLPYHQYTKLNERPIKVANTSKSAANKVVTP